MTFAIEGHVEISHCSRENLIIDASRRNLATVATGPRKVLTLESNFGFSLDAKARCSYARFSHFLDEIRQLIVQRFDDFINRIFDYFGSLSIEPFYYFSSWPVDIKRTILAGYGTAVFVIWKYTTSENRSSCSHWQPFRTFHSFVDTWDATGQSAFSVSCNCSVYSNWRLFILLNKRKKLCSSYSDQI